MQDAIDIIEDVFFRDAGVGIEALKVGELRVGDVVFTAIAVDERACFGCQ